MTRATAVLLLCLSSSVSAQKAVPRLYFAPDLRIEVKQIKAAGNGGSAGPLAIGPDGRIVIAPKNTYGDLRAFDSLGRTMKWKVPIGERDGEIGWLDNAGWMGNTFWVTDPRYEQIVFIGADAKVSKSIVYPSWVHPHWAERRKYPLFRGFQTLAVYPDTSMLVRPRGPRSLIDTPGFDKSLSYLLRIDKDGAIMRTVARWDEETGRVTLRDGRAEHTTQVPFAGATYWRVSGDGKHVVFVAPGASPADSGRIRVTAINENGDTVFSRRYAAPIVPVSRATTDSVLAQIRAWGPHSAEEIRASMAKRMPAFRSFVTGAFAGIDHSTWVVSRPVSDTAKTRTALILDERGEPLATADMPDGVSPLVVDRAHLWGIERGKLAIVRFRLQTTPPPPAPVEKSPKPAVKVVKK